MCTCCKVVLDLNEFGKWKYGKDGLKPQCKECCNLAQSAIYRKKKLKNEIVEYLSIKHKKSKKEVMEKYFDEIENRLKKQINKRG